MAARVTALKVTVLSTMLADRGLGEWGYSALVEVDGHKFLFDTGANPDVVLKNAKSLSIDLSEVEDVVISHNHDDHTGGLVSLRGELMKMNPRAMSRAHVSASIFLPRLKADGSDANGLTPFRAEYERLGGRFILHDSATELVPGVWFTGPVNDVVDWTGAQLRRLGVKYLLAGHCTGIEATMRLRAALGLTRKTAPVSSVGSSFTLGQGIQPGEIAA